MAANLYLDKVIIASVVNVIGVLASTFIVALNLLDWATGQRLSTCDLILLALGISSTCFQCIRMGDCYLQMLLEDYYLRGICPVLNQLLLWTSSSSVWLSTWLCFFYCVKIVDFNHCLFIWLKLRISKMVPWLLAGSVVMSLVLTMPLYQYSCIYSPKNATAKLPDNSTTPGVSAKLRLSYIILYNIFGFSVPLLLGVVSISLILASLHRHMRRMKEAASGFSQPRLKVHYVATRMVGSLLLIYVFLWGAVCAAQLAPLPMVNSVAYFISTSAVPLQSIILIMGNTRLKQALLKLLSTWRK